jgi:hypothetical protein
MPSIATSAAADGEKRRASLFTFFSPRLYYLKAVSGQLTYCYGSVERAERGMPAICTGNIRHHDNKR